MRFLVDECTGPSVATWLREQGYEVLSAYGQSRGASDDVLIQKAFTENWILITNVKDFGTVLPGHGGILDRIDSLLSAAPLAYYVLFFLIRTH